MTRAKTRNCLLGTLLLLCAICACNPNAADVVAAKPKSGYVGFYNLLPSQATINPFPGAINMYVNGTRQNDNKIPYGYFSGYVAIPSGPENIVFKSDSLRTDIYSQTGLALDTLYSTYFVIGKANGNAVTIIKTRDTAASDAVNIKPKMRFVHASADAPALDVVFNGVTIANKPYKSVSNFTRVDTGKVAVKVNLAGTGTTILSNTITLSPSGIYTMYLYGIYAGGVNSITYSIRTGH